MRTFEEKTPHEVLKNSLATNEEIWIYDEPNRLAVTVENYTNGKKVYSLMLFLPSRGVWNIIDIECTDEHGAQIMYDCARYTVQRCKTS